MSMLAAPRRKQKVINLRAKSSDWSNDTNKFGQRMLEKMGWSTGKGLGAKENGIVEHVVARYKNDEKGLGFEDKNDQWTKHEDDFNALLANLSNGDNNDEKLHSGASLEHKSKKSKARIHYHKFTRGKDISRYSERELANIFGKKSFKTDNETCGNATPEDEYTEELAKPSEQVFTEKGSMEDYFKNKLQAFKLKNKVMTVNNDNEVDYCFQGFSNSNNKDDKTCQQDSSVQQFSFYNTAPDGDSFNIEDSSQNPTIENDSQKKMKKKKSKSQNLQSNDCNDFYDNKATGCIENENLCNGSLEPQPKKVKKNNESEVIQNEIIDEEYIPKKRKSKKEVIVVENQEADNNDKQHGSIENEYLYNANFEPQPKKEKKSKKRCKDEKEVIVVENQEADNNDKQHGSVDNEYLCNANFEPQPKKEKKSKKRCKDVVVENEIEEYIPKKKKSKKEVFVESQEVDINVAIKKKKKKKNKHIKN